jgi:hypothetical protein
VRRRAGIIAPRAPSKRRACGSTDKEDRLKYRRLAPVVGAVVALALGAAQPASADRQPFPHEFHQNMGYCAPFLAQARLPNGDPVRPFINHLLQDLTAGDLTFEGQKNVGDLYSDRARSEEDQQCVARSG